MPTPENLEKKAIKKYLSYKKCFYFHILQGIGSFLGAPDIVAIREGIVYAVECKVKNKKGVLNKQSNHQISFQREWEAHGGIYILGGLDDVVNIIK